MSYDRGNRRSKSNKRRWRTTASNHVALNHVADGLFLTGGSRKSSPAPRSPSINKLWRIYTAATREIVPVSSISRRRFDLRGKRMWEIVKDRRVYVLRGHLSLWGYPSIYRGKLSRVLSHLLQYKRYMLHVNSWKYSNTYKFKNVWNFVI